LRLQDWSLEPALTKPVAQSGKAGAILKIGHFLPEAEMQRRERQQPRFTVSSPVRTRRRAMNARSHLPGGRVTPKPNPNQQVFVGVIL
jgi:hypothetical protein